MSVKQFLEAEVQMLKMMKVQRTHIGGYLSMGEFVLKNGVNFEPNPLPRGVKKGRAKECYANAARLVMSNPRRFIYCEGYAVGCIPVMHGFAIDTDCVVVDPTWHGEPCPLGTDYFGVAIKHDYLRKMMLKTETYGVIDQWTHGWPIMKDSPKKWRHPIMDELQQKEAA